MKPWLVLPPKLAHDLAPYALHALAALRTPHVHEWRSFTWKGLKFSNRLGIAGGVDKDASHAADWWAFGTGFLEVGTVTPEPQLANSGKIFDRSLSQRALWNRMGFPGRGAKRVAQNLKALRKPWPTPVFVNIGKNRTTPNESAADDYVQCMRTLADVADAYVINISSPNTTGLRDLFRAENFKSFLKSLLDAAEASEKRTPLLLKLSPDLEENELTTIIEQSCMMGIDGWIATNTTVARETGMMFPKEGGVSGQPLAARSKKVLARLIEILGPRREGRLIVSAGGIMTPQDVSERLDLGADLTQVYTALVFEGPKFFDQVADYMTPSK